MDLLGNLALGMSVALTMQNVGWCFVGVVLGTLIGVLPGIGPVSTIALLLPVTFSLPPATALILLAGIYYGAQYGGSTSAILVNLPGEASAAVTALDGYRLARKGRAGAALSIAAIGSFVAGTVATLAIALAAPALSGLVIRFGAEDYFALMVLGLVGATVLAQGSVLRAIGMVLLGLILGLVGTDTNTGTQRFAFGVPQLADGLGFVAIAMGLYGFSEIAVNLARRDAREVLAAPVGPLMPDRAEWRASWAPIARGTAIGSVLGVLPGGGALLASFASYSVEKRLSRHPERFGTGEIAGVAGPESANNAGAQTAFIPLLTLGIPPNPVLALMLGAMTIHAITPGPQVITANPQLFWGLVASMWVGNAMLVLLNLPLVGLWIRLLGVPYRTLYPAILLFGTLGVYVVSNSVVDVWVTVTFGALGVAFALLGAEVAPLLLGFVLGPMMEENLRRAMLIARGDPAVFVSSPISASLLAIAAAMLVATLVPSLRRGRARAFRG